MQHKVTAQIGSTQISIETGKIAKLADGSVIVSCGDTMVLTSAVSATKSRKARIGFRSRSITAKKRRRSENFPAAISNAKDALRKKKRSPRA
jgi:polyribonucleotide nucleotidyltransferase